MKKILLAVSLATALTTMNANLAAQAQTMAQTLAQPPSYMPSYNEQTAALNLDWLQFNQKSDELDLVEQTIEAIGIPLHHQLVTTHYFDHFKGPYSPRDVRTLQRSLALRGCDPGGIDGVMGPKTQAAMRDCYYMYW